MQRNSCFPAMYQSQLMKHSLMKHIQYSNKHQHPVPPTVLHSVDTAGQLSCINTAGTKSVYVCVRLLIQSTALKAHQILSLFATA